MTSLYGRSTRRSTAQPWVFGTFAVYAESPYRARQVYERLCADDAPPEPFGTVTLDSGEEIDWVNMRYGVVHDRLLESAH